MSLDLPTRTFSFCFSQPLTAHIEWEQRRKTFTNEIAVPADFHFSTVDRTWARRRQCILETLKLPSNRRQRIGKIQSVNLSVSFHKNDYSKRHDVAQFLSIIARHLESFRSSFYFSSISIVFVGQNRTKYTTDWERKYYVRLIHDDGSTELLLFFLFFSPSPAHSISFHLTYSISPIIIVVDGLTSLFFHHFPLPSATESPYIYIFHMPVDFFFVSRFSDGLCCLPTLTSNCIIYHFSLAAFHRGHFHYSAVRSYYIIRKWPQINQ